MFFFFRKNKKWADWRQVSENDIELLQHFILQHEFYSVPLSSRLTENKNRIDEGLLARNTVFIEEQNNEIISVIMFSPEGIICPIFTIKTSFEPLACIINESSYTKKRFLTLMGLKEDISHLETLFKNKSRLSIDYDFLSGKSSEIALKTDNYLRKKDSIFLNKLKARKAWPSDIETLMPLRSAYEIEEVVLKASNFNEPASKNRFKRTISQETVYFTQIDGRPIGTCCISASGFKWGQIGGVYTRPEYRSKGLSAHLMAAISKDAEKQEIDLMLFVKKDNTPALKLYSNCGFEKNDNYRISYLESK